VADPVTASAAPRVQTDHTRAAAEPATIRRAQRREDPERELEAPKDPPAPSLAPQPATAPLRAEAPAPVARAEEVRAAASDDPTLRGAVLPHAAHLRVDTAGGDLELHLRVREGVADVRADGAAAPLLERHVADLRVALASEGLRLGELHTPQSSGAPQSDPSGSNSHQQSHRGAPEERAPASPPPPPRAPAPSGPRPADASKGRIHVTA
jgi:hypothetical protein